jgi:hypothetical protein
VKPATIGAPARFHYKVAAGAADPSSRPRLSPIY